MLSYLTTAPQTRPHFLRFTLVSKQLKAQFLIVLSVLIIIVDETTTDIICIKCKKDESEHPNEIVLCDKCGIGNTDKNVLFGGGVGVQSAISQLNLKACASMQIVLHLCGASHYHF